MSYDQTLHVAPTIGYHRCALSQKFGAPRQPNLVALSSVIELIAPFNTPAAFVGLEDFSHIWLTWQFHHNVTDKPNQITKTLTKDKSGNTLEGSAEDNFRAQVRPPRLGGNQKIGVFASRSMYRPSALGLSVVKLERIEVIEGKVLLMISGADMIDGTPIIDIKPYVAYSDSIGDAISGFAPKAPLPLIVSITDEANEQFSQLTSGLETKLYSDLINMDFDNADDVLNHKKLVSKTKTATVYEAQQQLLDADKAIIKALIAQDPRPAYRRAQLNSFFIMRYKSVDVSFSQVAEGELQIDSFIKVDDS